jgi:pimeloyl-ACP methyl ester carboxylesterase
MKLLVDGREAYAHTGGKPFDPALPCIVFVHGALNDHSVFTLLARWFAHHGHAVLAVDLPGHRRSAGPPLTSVEDMAGWLLRLLDTAGVQRAVLAGHSMGSLIALEAAGRAPERAVQLWMLGTAYPMKVSPALLETAREREPVAIDMVNQWSHSSIAQKPSAPAPGFYVPAGSRRLMQRISQRNPEQVFFTDFSACNDYAHGEQAAASLHCPALFLLGRKDMMTPPKAASVLAAAMPDAKVVTLEGSGHALMAEQPDQVVESLFRFASGAAK